MRPAAARGGLPPPLPSCSIVPSPPSRPPRRCGVAPPLLMVLLLRGRVLLGRSGVPALPMAAMQEARTGAYVAGGGGGLLVGVCGGGGGGGFVL